MAINHLKPKSKDEIIVALETVQLNKELLEIIKKDDDAYQFVAWFISQGEGSPANKTSRLNGLCRIIIGMVGK